MSEAFNRSAFTSPITPRYREVFYSSLPVDWQDDPLQCLVCLPCSRDTFVPPDRTPLVVNGEVVK